MAGRSKADSESGGPKQEQQFRGQARKSTGKVQRILLQRQGPTGNGRFIALLSGACGLHLSCQVTQSLVRNLMVRLRVSWSRYVASLSAAWFSACGCHRLGFEFQGLRQRWYLSRYLADLSCSSSCSSSAIALPGLFITGPTCARKMKFPWMLQ